MEKRDLVKDMENFAGSSFITKAQICKYVGVSHPRYVSKYVEGLKRLSGRRYFIPEVAAKLIEDFY